MVDAFEREFADRVDLKYAVALSSGTAAMYLALQCLGIRPGDEVFASTLTFIGGVSPITFMRADPVFIDCDRDSWNMDPVLLAEELATCHKRGRLPKAVVPTDLYGQCCDLGRIVEICDRYGVPVVCDSAEAVGARYKSSKQGEAEISKLKEVAGWVHAGAGAKAAVYSFNGNKIITTSGGGMLASDDEDLIEHARFLSQQARDPFPHYEHSEIGYNYRMSNILEAIGRGQLTILDERVKRKREIFEYYKAALGDVPGIEFMPEAPCGRSNHWLTVILITPEEFGADREQARLALEEENIEARPVWKPMHMQPVFRVEGLKAQGPRFKGYQRNRTYKARVVGGEVAEDLFNRGLCLPSGTAMANPDLDRVINTILKSATNARRCIQTHKSKTLHMHINDITYRINGAGCEVNRVLGGGFLEKGHSVK